MSFDIFLQCFEGGNFSKFRRHIAWEKFAPYATGSFGHYELRFPDGSRGYLSIDDGDEIDGLAVNRPGGDMLYDLIYEIMRQTSTILYWNDGGVIARASVALQIPSQFLSALGTPRIVRSGHEIIAYITGNNAIVPAGTHANDNDHRDSLEGP